MLRACAVLLAAAGALSCPARAQACKCAPPPAVLDALHSAAAVFEGSVSKLTPLGETELIVELNVSRTWKAAGTEHILLRTRQDSAACGFPFSPGESYLVYADAAPNDANLPGLEVSHCGRTKPMAEADADVTELGMGVVPVSARQTEAPSADTGVIAEQHAKPAGAGCQRCTAVGGAASTPSRTSLLSAAGLAACWMLRRQRRQRRR